jgi:hypothetical protein
MIRFRTLLFPALAGSILLAGSVCPASRAATEGRPDNSRQEKSPQEILNATAERGVLLVNALREYTYYADLTIETVSDAEVITGKYYRLSRIWFDRNGTRQERVLETTSTLPKDVFIGSNAANNLTRVYTFIVTPECFQQYDLTYVGRERVDELNTYVFDVKPKVKLPDPERSSDRYLKGRIWIDDQDLCVVKVAGDALPEQSAHRTPKFETYYQNYGRFWFPSFCSADDTIRVGRYLRRVVVKARFTGYKKTEAQ